MPTGLCKDCWRAMIGGGRQNIAESVAGGVVAPTQLFLSQAAWEGAEVLEELRAHVGEVFEECGGPDQCRRDGLSEERDEVSRRATAILGDHEAASG